MVLECSVPGSEDSLSSFVDLYRVNLRPCRRPGLNLSEAPPKCLFGQSWGPRPAGCSPPAQPAIVVSIGQDSPDQLHWVGCALGSPRNRSGSPMAARSLGETLPAHPVGEELGAA
jgi:hypothetical protein